VPSVTDFTLNIKEPFELIEVLSNQMGEFFQKKATTISYQM
jgi:hypothetical protein